MLYQLSYSRLKNIKTKVPLRFYFYIKIRLIASHANLSVMLKNQAGFNVLSSYWDRTSVSPRKAANPNQLDERTNSMINQFWSDGLKGITIETLIIITFYWLKATQSQKLFTTTFFIFNILKMQLTQLPRFFCYFTSITEVIIASAGEYTWLLLRIRTFNLPPIVVSPLSSGAVPSTLQAFRTLRRSPGIE